MKDKFGTPLYYGAWVAYTRTTYFGEPITELGKVFECQPSGVFMTIRGGCFHTSDPDDIRIITDEEAMLMKLEQ